MSIETRVRANNNSSAGGGGQAGTGGGNIAVPLIIASGGTGTSAAGSATTLVGMNSSGASYQYYNLLGSDNVTVVRSGTGYFISAVAGGTGNMAIGGAITGATSGSVLFVGSGNVLLQDVSQFYWDDANNRLGIGMSSPVHKLDVYGIVGDTILGVGDIPNAGAPSVYFRAESSSRIGGVGTRSAHAFYIFANDNEYLRVSTGGNVGIGTTITPELFSVGSNSPFRVNSNGALGVGGAFFGNSGQVLMSNGSTFSLSWISVGAGGGNGVVNAGSAGNLTYYAQAGTAVDDLVIGSSHTILGVNSSGASHTYYNLLASDNATVIKSGTGIFISATTSAGGGSGTVQIGSTHHLAFYPAVGTTVSGSLIRIGTGTGIAHFNLSILTSNAANSVNGDIWFQSSSNRVYLFSRSNNANYFVVMNT